MRHLSEENLQETQKGHTGGKKELSKIHGYGKSHKKEMIFQQRSNTWNWQKSKRKN